MKWQGWRGNVVGVFASLSLIGFVGAGVAHAEDVAQAEPYFEVPQEPGEQFAGVAPQSEPYFEVPQEPGEAFASVPTGSEPSFDVKTEEDQAVATGGQQQQSERPFGLRTR
jgi:hypothetical protein